MRKRFLRGAVWLAAGMLCGLTLGCGMQKKAVWAEDYLVTFYTTPRQIQVGENLAAFRIQDRDYKIMEVDNANLELWDEQKNKIQTVVLKSGPGRDYRGWISFPGSGHYVVHVTFSVQARNDFDAGFDVIVPGDK